MFSAPEWDETLVIIIYHRGKAQRKCHAITHTFVDKPCKGRDVYWAVRIHSGFSIICGSAVLQVFIGNYYYKAAGMGQGKYESRAGKLLLWVIMYFTSNCCRRIVSFNCIMEEYNIVVVTYSQQGTVQWLHRKKGEFNAFNDNVNGYGRIFVTEETVLVRSGERKQ